MRSEFSHFAEEVRREIDELLSGVGILFRVFARGKDNESLSKKLAKEPGKYHSSGKLIQDAIGVRIALYFPDDISIVKSILESRFPIQAGSSTIDRPDSDQFSVTRYNLIFSLSDEMADSFSRISKGRPLDTTFEVQLRSILSEGWHEVEHDLRYKSKEHWSGHSDLSRVLNGIVATLETSEWNMARIFEELAYRHYKSQNWQGMLPSLLRMRLRGSLSADLLTALTENTEAAKDLLRIDRARFISLLSRARPKIPITADNVVLFWNLVGPRHECLEGITPLVLKEAALGALPPAKSD